MKEAYRPYTAFLTPWGIYEWQGIPFDLSGALGCFQTFMENNLFSLRDRICIPYLDGVIVFVNLSVSVYRMSGQFLKYNEVMV